jgi:membrane peptidoglycan carboxypeptidase
LTVPRRAGHRYYPGVDAFEPPAQPTEPTPCPAPATRRRWVRIAVRAADAVLLAAVLGALALRCSVPDTAQLAGENPTSTAFIDLRRAEAVAAGKPFTLRWQWRPLGQISRYLRTTVIYAEDDTFYRHGVDRFVGPVREHRPPRDGATGLGPASLFGT